jgi:hypothetical protein
VRALEENMMTATYTFDGFSRLDGYGSCDGGDWGKQGTRWAETNTSNER